MARRGLTAGDRAVWAGFAQLVAPLPGVVVPPPPVVPRTPAEPVAPGPGQSEPARVAVPRRREGALAVGGVPAGVDKATLARFRSGKLPVMRTLDLHGRTANVAYGALEHFLVRAVGDGVRCVEVITGRGKGEHGGVLRREFPLWLNAPHLRPMILAAAHPHALNPGSVRLLLRRVRG